MTCPRSFRQLEAEPGLDPCVLTTVIISFLHISFKTRPKAPQPDNCGGLWFLFAEHERPGVHLMAPIIGGECWEHLGSQSHISGE